MHCHNSTGISRVRLRLFGVHHRFLGNSISILLSDYCKDEMQCTYNDRLRIRFISAYIPRSTKFEPLKISISRRAGHIE